MSVRILDHDPEDAIDEFEGLPDVFIINAPGKDRFYRLDGFPIKDKLLVVLDQVFPELRQQSSNEIRPVPFTPREIRERNVSTRIHFIFNSNYFI